MGKGGTQAVLPLPHPIIIWVNIIVINAKSHKQAIGQKLRGRKLLSHVGLARYTDWCS